MTLKNRRILRDGTIEWQHSTFRGAVIRLSPPLYEDKPDAPPASETEEDIVKTATAAKLRRLAEHDAFDRRGPSEADTADDDEDL